LNFSSIYLYLKEKLKEYINLLKKCPHSNEEILSLASLHARRKDALIQMKKYCFLHPCMLGEKKYEYRE
jgi:hypothetical protein